MAGSEVSRFLSLDPAGRVVEDLPCPRCGYNVRGVSLDQYCPECGAELATEFERLPARGAAWARRMLLGRLLLFASMVFLVVVMFWRHWWPMNLAMVAGVWFASSPMPAWEQRFGLSNWRWSARLATLAAMVALMVAAHLPWHILSALSGYRPGCLGLVAVSLICTGMYRRRLRQVIGARGMEVGSGWIVWVPAMVLTLNWLRLL